MSRWLFAFILALVLPCYGFAAAGHPLQAEADRAGQACQPSAHAPTACDVAELLGDQPGQHDASDDVSSQPFQVSQASGLPQPGSLSLLESAPPFLEGVMRPPSRTARPR
jgi:hypothetical protein